MPDETDLQVWVVHSWNPLGSATSADIVQFGGHMELGCFAQDRELRYTLVLNAAPGWSAEKVLGKTDRELTLRPEDADSLERLKLAVLSSGKGVRRLVQLLQPDGDLHSFSIGVEPIRDQSGTVQGVLSLAADVTAADPAMRAATERLEAFVVRRLARQLTCIPTSEMQLIAAVELERHPAPGPESPSRPGNSLLSLLPVESRERLLARCDTVSLQAGHVLGNGQPVYLFPLTGLVSIIVRDLTGEETEIASVGNDGFIDTDVTHQHGSLEARVTVAAQALRLSARDFAELARNDPKLVYIEALNIRLLFRKTVRGRICAQNHRGTGRVAAYLFQSAQLVEGPLPFTHEQIANALGLGRPTVTASMMELHQLAAIDRRRGSVTITDRERLAAAACACVTAGSLHTVSASAGHNPEAR
jgi:PAS domain S-box-containing protein